MSQQLPRIDLPDLLYWEIMQAAEEHKRTLAEEIISRLRQKSISEIIPPEREIDSAL